MTSPNYGGDALLIAGELQIPVDARLEVFGIKTEHKWRGILHDIPTQMFFDLQDSDDVRLRMPDGQERRVFLREVTYSHEDEFTSVPISGDGTPPF
ncbi:hypothetical protein J7E87_33905 [Streptomyces sp. ISL-1]|uniref:hypothetical protein n=1 Tax=Streptomyces sp. ISL-1 TaxID=2817657 RepID=UPI001BE7B245|nr:hypothetical protein [Streptomyces sp. ISL-1]MBT2394266.1 hypothetical protein [Streptomyces sp. ISL-1]